MTTKHTGGPAFPVPLNPGESYQGHGPCDGMSLRDWFAGLAMQALIAGYPEKLVVGPDIPNDNKRISIVAFSMADDMLKTREES